MKTVCISAFILLTTLMAKGQNANPEYDSTLAAQLGADERGMKMYVLVILKTGPNDVQDKALRDSLFAGHFSNMNRMVKENKLVVAGPLGTNDRQYRGIFILNVKTTEEAELLLQTDPTVREGIFATEIYPWYGSAALPMYMGYDKKLTKEKR
jgi:uncharacterized protein YciI